MILDELAASWLVLIDKGDCTLCTSSTELEPGSTWSTTHEDAGQAYWTLLVSFPLSTHTSDGHLSSRCCHGLLS